FRCVSTSNRLPGSSKVSESRSETETVSHVVSAHRWSRDVVRCASLGPEPERGKRIMLLYDSVISGNCYKVRLLLAHLGIPYERRTVDVVDRSNRDELLGELNPAL